MRRLTAAIVTTAVLAVTPPAVADPLLPGVPDLLDVELSHLFTVLPGLVEGLAENRTDMARCPELAGGTVGIPELTTPPGRDTDSGNPLKAGDVSSAPRTLPSQVIFRDTRQSFNRRYQFAVADGDIYYKSNTAVTDIQEPWAPLAMSPCFQGQVIGLSVDDDELIAISRDRWIFQMDNALAEPAYFNWTMRWGFPFWLGAGRTLPKEISDWDWSVISKLEDGTWRDTAGNDHAVGDAKVSHIWTLSKGGRRLTYLDPWLPSDESYEACGPHRGRFRARSLSASGSTLFVVGGHGDLFTRLYDFDLAGADPLFFDYAYDDQRGVPNPAIQLPSPAWIEQPKIPGVITDRISIHKVGRGTLHHQLRVEGRRKGVNGYWHKHIRANRWTFTATRRSLTGTRLDNPPRDTSAVGLGISEDRRYVGTHAGTRLEIPTFNTYCTPTPINVRLSTGEAFSLRLHTVDDIREQRRSRGLDANPRLVRGTIEIPAAVRNSTNPRVRAFAASVGTGRWVNAPLDATLGSLRFREQGWALAFGG